MKKKATTWAKTLANHASDTGFVFRISKWLLQVVRKLGFQKDKTFEQIPH